MVFGGKLYSEKRNLVGYLKKIVVNILKNLNTCQQGISVVRG